MRLCALIPAYVSNSDAVELILKYLIILACFTMFVTATAIGLVGRERSAFSKLGSPYPAYVPNSKPELWRPT